MILIEHNQVTAASIALRASSSVGATKKPLSLGRQLMQKISPAYEAIKNEPQAIVGLSRSLQDVRDADQFLDKHRQSYPCVTASSLSSLHKNHSTPPLYANYAEVTTRDSHDVTARPDKAVEPNYDYIYYDLTSLKHQASAIGICVNYPQLMPCNS